MKFEIRKLKTDDRTKSELRKPNADEPSGVRASGFGLQIWFGYRNSEFGL
jgi:hypothetical protein